MKVLFLIYFLTSFSLSFSQDSSNIAQRFRDRVYVDVATIQPKGFDDWGGGILHSTSYGATMFYNDSSKKLILILEEEIGRAEPHAIWKILDAIITDLDTLKFQWWTFDEIGPCSKNSGEVINPVLVITNRSNNSIRDAWQVDPRESKIQRLNSRDLKCIFHLFKD